MPGRRLVDEQVRVAAVGPLLLAVDQVALQGGSCLRREEVFLPPMASRPSMTSVTDSVRSWSGRSQWKIRRVPQAALAGSGSLTRRRSTGTSIGTGVLRLNS
jgi:hypothetical protein